MHPTVDLADINYSMVLVRLYPDCFSGVSKAELLSGYLFVDQGREVMLHAKPESRGKVYGVPIHFGAYQITHIASSKRGVAGGYLQEFLTWAGNPPLWLFVKTDNQRAISFYERHGFSKVSVATFPSFSSFVMVRRG